MWAGKRTLAVRFGGRFARAQYVARVERRAGWDLALRQPANRYATLVGGAYVALAVTAGISARAERYTSAVSPDGGTIYIGGNYGIEKYSPGGVR